MKREEHDVREVVLAADPVFDCQAQRQRPILLVARRFDAVGQGVRIESLFNWSLLLVIVLVVFVVFLILPLVNDADVLVLGVVVILVLAVRFDELLRGARGGLDQERIALHARDLRSPIGIDPIGQLLQHSLGNAHTFVSLRVVGSRVDAGKMQSLSD